MSTREDAENNQWRVNTALSDVVFPIPLQELEKIAEQYDCYVDFPDANSLLILEEQHFLPNGCIWVQVYSKTGVTLGMCRNSFPVC